MSDLCLDIWAARPPRAGTAVVLPDGCRDLIVRLAPGEAPCWFISELPSSAETVAFAAGVAMKGLRLRAGTRIDDARLIAAARRMAPDDDRGLRRLVDEFCARDGNTDEALSALAEAASVAQGARRAGVTIRTLQRQVMDATGRPPLYWQRLARVRRAARALGADAALAEIACGHGFADQAHFSRECRHWFGLTPAALRRRGDLLAMLAAPAYAG
jgi:AraC-like DNA-binding protein